VNGYKRNVSFYLDKIQSREQVNYEQIGRQMGDSMRGKNAINMIQQLPGHTQTNRNRLALQSTTARALVETNSPMQGFLNPLTTLNHRENFHKDGPRFNKRAAARAKGHIAKKGKVKVKELTFLLFRGDFQHVVAPEQLSYRKGGQE
jgi:hypothetical protein